MRSRIPAISRRWDDVPSSSTFGSIANRSSTRTIAVLKTRASHHDGQTREFHITSDGIVLT